MWERGRLDQGVSAQTPVAWPSSPEAWEGKLLRAQELSGRTCEASSAGAGRAACAGRGDGRARPRFDGLRCLVGDEWPAAGGVAEWSGRSGARDEGSG